MERFLDCLAVNLCMPLIDNGWLYFCSKVTAANAA